MRAFASVALAALIAAAAAPSAWAAEATATVEPVSAPQSEQAPALSEAPAVPAEDEPVDVLLGLGGVGADSRSDGAPAEPLEVRWHFAIVGAPAGTSLHVWAQFAGAGEVEAVGADTVTIVTPGHDVLIDGMASALLPRMIEGVEVRLVGVEVVPRPVPAASDPVAPAKPSAPGPRSNASGEEYLPFTGTSERLLVLAAAFVAFGAALRLAATRLQPDRAC